jgi:hypothetical protein
MSSISASKLLKENIATVGKSTVCNIFKKKVPKYLIRVKLKKSV